MPFIERPTSLIIAADVKHEYELAGLADAAERVPEVGAIKVGCTLVLRFGLPWVCHTIRRCTSKPIIYDHQKAGTDIPDMAIPFVEACEPVDAVILFPMAGPVTQVAFIEALNNIGKTVIVGAVMTHPGYLESDDMPGYISTRAPARILRFALDHGVRDFVVPGNNSEAIFAARAILEADFYPEAFTLYSPGFVSQGGEIPEARKAAGPRWHAIVGRAVYNAPNPLEALCQLAKSIS